MHLDANYLYGWAMSQKLPVNDFEWVQKLPECNSVKFDERFIKNYDEDSNNGNFFEADFEYLKSLYNMHSDLSSLPGRLKIEKCYKLVRNVYDKKNYVVHIKALKEALNNRVIRFNQKACLKPYFDMNTELRK